MFRSLPKSLPMAEDFSLSPYYKKVSMQVCESYTLGDARKRNLKEEFNEPWISLKMELKGRARRNLKRGYV
jgi:hypothetical protein